MQLRVPGQLLIRQGSDDMIQKVKSDSTLLCRWTLVLSFVSTAVLCVSQASGYEFATHAAMTREALLRSALVQNEGLVQLGFRGYLGDMSLSGRYMDLTKDLGPVL